MKESDLLRDQIERGEGGILLYGLTPPKLATAPERLSEIAARQVERIRALRPDGLVLYDIQDEAMRQEGRPFPFSPTHDPVDYYRDRLATAGAPSICYRAVGKLDQSELADELAARRDEAMVFVGAPSRDQPTRTSLKRAYEIRRQVAPRSLLGGVAIPERHLGKGDEHERVIAKMQAGCAFFITQCVYDVETSKRFLADYAQGCKRLGLRPATILFTLTPCGSVRTLEFMKWLGISLPAALEAELRAAGDILEASVQASLRGFAELQETAHALGVPVGCNIESVAARKVEIEAALELGREVRVLLERERAPWALRRAS